MSAKAPRGERMLVFTLASIQFINVLEFMIVMPLGPDFAGALGIPTSELGKIGGSYTAAAALASLICSTFIERFDRRKALAVAMAGLIIATVAVGFATGLYSLLAARVLAGIFGGPAAALSLAIVADVVPPERRGKAMGAVMASFSVASIIGVPVGLKLAQLGGWRMPFFAVAALGVVVVGIALWKLPPLRKHLERAATAPAGASGFLTLLGNPLVRTSYLMTTTVMMGSFMLIPNIAAYVQHNLGYPRADLDTLYFVGGILTFFSMRLVGSLTDRFGSFIVGTGGTVLLLFVIYFGFVNYLHWPVMILFSGFMVASSTRNVPYNALSSQVPAMHERARFMSLQSAIQHISVAAGAFIASAMLQEAPNGALIGIETVGLLAMAISVTLPFMLWTVQRKVRARARELVAANPPSLAAGG